MPLLEYTTPARCGSARSPGPGIGSSISRSVTSVQLLPASELANCLTPESESEVAAYTTPGRSPVRHEACDSSHPRPVARPARDHDGLPLGARGGQASSRKEKGEDDTGPKAHRHVEYTDEPTWRSFDPARDKAPSARPTGARMRRRDTYGSGGGWRSICPGTKIGSCDWLSITAAYA